MANNSLMNYYVFFLGLFILLFTITDLINTSLSVSGTGFLSRRLSTGIWKLLLVIHRRWRAKRILGMGGVIILMSILINWLLLIWLSASLLFISQAESLMNVETNTATTIVSKIFYAGYTLSTLGLGDIEPVGPFWELLTATLSFTGLISISIAITYLIPVVSAEIVKRRISVYITTLGSSVEEILLNFWNGKDFKELELPFGNLTNLIILHAQNHKAYSVLHYFHAKDRKEAFVLNITNLDEVLTILLTRIPVHHRPGFNNIMGLRKAISSYLITLPAVFITPAKEVPPVLPLKKLEDCGIEIIWDQKAEATVVHLSARRRLLLSLIKDDGWEWDDLQAGGYDHEMSMIK